MTCNLFLHDSQSRRQPIEYTVSIVFTINGMTTEDTNETIHFIRKQITFIESFLIFHVANIFPAAIGIRLKFFECRENAMLLHFASFH